MIVLFCSLTPIAYVRPSQALILVLTALAPAPLDDSVLSWVSEKKKSERGRMEVAHLSLFTAARVAKMNVSSLQKGKSKFGSDAMFRPGKYLALIISRVV